MVLLKVEENEVSADVVGYSGAVSGAYV